MTTDGQPPFRAEHVGSFVRPERLLPAARAHRAGDLDADAYREIQDACIREVVAWQDEIGMPSVTDGEFRRRSWSAGVIDALDGFGLREEGALKFRTDSGELGLAASPYAKAPLSRRQRIVADAESDGQLARLSPLVFVASVAGAHPSTRSQLARDPECRLPAPEPGSPAAAAIVACGGGGAR